MPSRGFHKEDIVRTPNGSRAVVTSVRHIAGREKVTVKYDNPILHRKATFDAAALRKEG